MGRVSGEWDPEAAGWQPIGWTDQPWQVEVAASPADESMHRFRAECAEQWSGGDHRCVLPPFHFGACLCSCGAGR